MFPLLAPPLSYEMAQRCLGPLVESTAETITSLHESDFAHLDVWLENICFCYNAAVLIDFEYACDVTTDRDSAPQYRYGDTVSCMFKRHTPEIQTAAHYDWMQLGWMAFRMHNLKSMNDVPIYHNMELHWPQKQICPFLEQAVTYGVYSRDRLHRSPICMEHMESLACVMGHT